MAEALNEAIISYLTTYAISQAGTPSLQAGWARDLRTAAENCLAMLAPGYVNEYPPHRIPSEVYSALFHNGTPEDLSGAQMRFLGFESEWRALEKIPSALWLLRKFADNAERGWLERRLPRGSRHRSRAGLLNWVSNLGCVYQEAFGRRPPAQPEANAPFARFSEAVRKQLAKTGDNVTESGTDRKAYRELDAFKAGALASFVRRHQARLRERWREALVRKYVPDRIKLGVILIRRVPKTLAIKHIVVRVPALSGQLASENDDTRQ